MKSHSKDIEVRRCRPLLGTFVEITAGGLPEVELHAAIDTAFAAVETVQRRMSVHHPASELSVLNREAASHPVTVSQPLFTLLRRGHKLAAASGGAFDCTVAPTLARWGLLPKILARNKRGTWRDVLLLPRRKVYFVRPVALDLGGIAKGFAVDLAIGILRRRGVQGALVNAGGDLRAFGPKSAIIHLRHPANPRGFAGKISIRDSALATSSPCFTERSWRGAGAGRPMRVSHLVNSLRQTPITGAVSVSVRAKYCWLADGLTKIVLNAPQLARQLLARHRAQAFVVTA